MFFASGNSFLRYKTMCESVTIVGEREIASVFKSSLINEQQSIIKASEDCESKSQPTEASVPYKQSLSDVSELWEKNLSSSSISSTPYATASIAENPLVIDECTSSDSAEIASRPNPTALQCAKFQSPAYVSTVKDMYRMSRRSE